MSFIKKYLKKENLLFLIIGLAIALIAIVFSYNYAEKYVEERLNHYEGLSNTGGFPTAKYDGNKYFQDEFNFRAYSDGTYESKRGIDVSEHNGEIDWAAVKESGVEFVMIRLGYRGAESGAIFDDVRFEEYAKGAKKHGIEIGVYFFSQAINTDEAVEEAAYVCKKVRNKKITMPIAFDMEEVPGIEGRIMGLSMEEKTEIADAFCQVVENHGYDSLIYGNPTWIYGGLNLSLIPNRKLWLAHYMPATGFPYEYAMWQYSDEGVIGGICTVADLNIFYVKKEVK